MTDIAAPDAPRAKRWFRAGSTVPPLSRDEARRESETVRLAREALGIEAARAFLNTVDPSLGGRPIAIATGSADGIRAVGALIEARRRQMAVPAPGAARA